MVVDREPGQYLGHPTTVLLEAGKTMLVVSPKGHGKGPIVMKRGGDGGLTRSDRLPTHENRSISQETPTIPRVVEAAGQKRLIPFSGLIHIRMAVREDDGATWSPLDKIGDSGGVVARASVDRLRDGTDMGLFHGDGLNARIRKEQGLSGKPDLRARPGPIARRETDRRPAPRESRKRNAHVIISDDEGAAWTPPRELPLDLTDDRHVGEFAPDGRLFLSFRDTARNSPPRGIGSLGRHL